MIGERFQRAQPDRLLGMLDGGVIRSANASRQSVKAENDSGVGVDHHRAIDRGHGEGMVTRQARPHRSTQSERHRGVAARGNSDPRHAPRCLAVIRLRLGPLHQMALLMAPGAERVGHRIAGVALQDLGKQPQSLSVVFRRLGKARVKGAQGQIIRVLGPFGFAPGAFDLGLAQHRRDRADHALGYLVLQIEGIFEGAVKAVGP